LSDYTRESVVRALKEAGIEQGDSIFCHISFGRLGRPDCALNAESIHRLMHQALRETVGDSGTILIPTYTYSIGKNEPFVTESTPSTVGPFTEYFRTCPGVLRSAEPMLAVSGEGPKAANFLSDLPHTSYGHGSIYERLRNEGTKVCTLGLPLHWATFRHHIEELAGVPFRFCKHFTGKVISQGLSQIQTWSYFAALRQTQCNPNGRRLQELLRSRSQCIVAPLGRSEVWSIRASEYFDFGLEALREDPWYTAEGPPCSLSNLLEMEDSRVGATKLQIRLGCNSHCLEIIAKLTPLARDVVSSDCDAALDALAAIAPLSIHEYASGTPFFGRIVPEKWTCTEAWIESLQGDRLLDRVNSPLHVVSYSEQFEGDISREALLSHLHVHSELRNAIPFREFQNERNWGLCSSQTFKESLAEEAYRVKIKASFSFGLLKVGEMTLPGEDDGSFLILAYLGSPAQANSGLSGVAVALEAMRRLSHGPRLKHTVRLLITSSSVGALTWISQNRNLLPNLRAGLTLDLLGLNHPHVLDHSARHTEWSKVAQCTLTNHDPKFRDGACPQYSYRPLRDLEIPEICFPWISLFRGERLSSTETHGRPFPEYQTHLDDPSKILESALKESIDLAEKIIRNWDLVS
jgi:aminopeptidase-like protein/aminoglycoside N3'-acetyltransferase